MKEIIIAILSIFLIISSIQGFSATFKITYYETTLKNNKRLFSPERWEGIQDIMDDFWRFIR